MNRPTRIVLAAASALWLLSCTEEKKPSSPEIAAPGAGTAAPSFEALVGSKIDLSELLGPADSAVFRPGADGSGVEAAYAFRGRGGMSGVAPILSKLGAELEPSESQDCWMPWEDLVDLSTTRPGAFMGAFRGQTFQLTLWIDQYARDLFICYQDPAPPEPTE